MGSRADALRLAFGEARRQNSLIGHKGRTFHCEFSPVDPSDGSELLATASEDGSVRVWDAATRKCYHTLSHSTDSEVGRTMRHDDGRARGAPNHTSPYATPDLRAAPDGYDVGRVVLVFGGGVGGVAGAPRRMGAGRALRWRERAGPAPRDHRRGRRAEALARRCAPRRPLGRDVRPQGRA